MGIIVENGGILTTVQDEGRFGYQAFGVSTSGAMDNHSFHIANILYSRICLILFRLNSHVDGILSEARRWISVTLITKIHSWYMPVTG